MPVWRVVSTVLSYAAKISMLCALLCATRCAPPVNGPRQDWISRPELVSVARAREGIYALSVNRFPEAEMKLRQALYLAPQAENIELNLIAALEGAEQFEEAEAILNRRLEKAPNEIDLLLRRAHLHLSMRHYEKAVALYQQVLEMHEEEKSWGDAGQIARILGQVAEARGDVEAMLCYSSLAVIYQPSISAYVAHARMLLGLDYPEAADDLLSQYVLDNPASENDVTILHAQALVRLAFDDLKGAWEREELVVMNPKLDPALLREVQLVRAVASEDAEVQAGLDDKDREELADEWDGLKGSLTAEQNVYNEWPSHFVSLLLAKVERDGDE